MQSNSFENFSRRHIGVNKDDTEKMVSFLGFHSLDEFINHVVPENIRLKKQLMLPSAFTEYEMLNRLRTLASMNEVYKTYIGMGYYGTITPSVIQRNILENPGWYTAYTPYQAEIAQGRLEALLNFQTMVSDLTGLPIANASLLDEPTAAAEAMIMLYHQSRAKKKGSVFYVSETCHPQTIDVIHTRAEALNIKVQVGSIFDLDYKSDEYFGCLIQYPNTNGSIEDYTQIIKNLKTYEIYVIMATDLLALALIKSPGELGADVAVGSTQRFGVPMGYGGPHAAFFATTDEFKRAIPGRIIGVTIDANGKYALRMALQTREQHIRREKATSNICTSQVLLAVVASMYAVYHGKEGILHIAQNIHRKAQILLKALKQLHLYQEHNYFFDTLKVEFTDNAGIKRDILRMEAEKDKINFRYFDDFSIGISVDETTSLEDLDAIVKVFAKSIDEQLDLPNVFAISHEVQQNNIPNYAIRTTSYLDNPIFNTYHSEHQMLRYIKSLERKDLSLTTSMISLGSCTMKLNATTEMMPITWPEFANIHPYAPKNQAKGYHTIFLELERALCQITGFSAVSFQPNSGAQGEYTGLLVIRAYLKDKGQGHRNVMLIPASAHGTNPASAVMAGFQVVVVKCDENGNIDFEHLKQLADIHKDNLAGLMVTYPSTHGVFEESIQDVCSLIHAYGGQVYMDGANMNAQVGLTSPAMIGADVCHLNLHKTFCIPHGGGGPGMGPICVAKHLVPYLPKMVFDRKPNDKNISAVAASQYSSALILLISYAYIGMMGEKGLTNATKYAILNANYMMKRLETRYKVLYKGKNGFCAHEFILDLRAFKHTCGIEVEDVAKRLMDYGFHAPTVSFPVPGTLMIEPTESEPKEELDRFCDALLQIYEEIMEVQEGKVDKTDNVLKNAPHTAEMVTADIWRHPYSREKAAFPLPYLKQNKFWPAVARVNNTYGDRNLVCVCPPTEAYAV
jgi:glycine dehydrogenase